MLHIIFCAAPKMGERLTEHTRKLVEASHVAAYTAGVTPDALDIARLLGGAEQDGLVIVLSALDIVNPDERQRLAIKVRADFPKAYIVYITSSYDELLRLTNKNLRFSGCFINTVRETEYAAVLMNIFEDYGRSSLDPGQYFTVAVGKHMQTFVYDDILYFESLNKKVRIVTRSLAVDKVQEFYESLTNIANKLKGRFLRCHSGFLVNIRHIRGASFKDMTLTLSDHTAVPFSQAHKREVTDLINLRKT